MNRKHCVLFGALTVAAILAGCASPQMRRIDASRAVYETWPIEMRQAVLDGKVEPGMTPEMVEVAWGKPSEVVDRGGAGEEIWIYRSGGSAPMMYPGTSVGGGMSGNGIGITTGGGSTTIGSSTNVGIGSSGIGMGGMGGMGGPVMMPGTPEDEREVVFRNGVVQRADPPPPK